MGFPAAILPGEALQAAAPHPGRARWRVKLPPSFATSGAAKNWGIFQLAGHPPSLAGIAKPPNTHKSTMEGGHKPVPGFGVIFKAHHKSTRCLEKALSLYLLGFEAFGWRGATV